VSKWDGSAKTGSQRHADAAAKTDKAPAPKKPSFDPFDQKSWWKKADKPKESDAATPTKYKFNPFDQASWWKQTKGTGVDVSA
jgi:hypothetical protein